MAIAAVAAAKGSAESPDGEPPPEPPAATATDEPRAPRVIIVPHLDVGEDPAWWYAAEVGASVAYRTRIGLDVGAHFALGGAIGGAMNDCYTCGGPGSAGLWRAGAMIEQHLAPEAVADPWIGLQAEVVHAELEMSVFHWPLYPGDQYQHYTESVPYTGVVFAPTVGLDLVGRWNRGLAGFGIFGSAPCRIMQGAGGCGLMAGIRVPLGLP
jgi:hypothetical protein